MTSVLSRSQVSAELLKLRTTRAAWIAVPLVLALAVGLPIAGGALAGSGDMAELTAASVLDMVRAPVQLAGAAILLLGLLSAAGEFRHRTVLVTRLAQPRPVRVFAAKLAAIATVGVAVGIAMDALTVGAASVVLRTHDLPVQLSSHGVPRVLLLAPVVLAAYGVIGVAVGALIRNTAGAVGATLVWAFVIEGFLPLAFSSPHLADRLPSAAFKTVLQQHASAGGPTPALAAALLAAYVVGLTVVAGIADRQREL
jgi:hypothetical protein